MIRAVAGCLLAALFLLVASSSWLRKNARRSEERARIRRMAEQARRAEVLRALIRRNRREK